MTLPARRALACACLAACFTPAVQAATATELTLYRSDSPSLYTAAGDGSVGEGHAVAREQRMLQLKAGTQDITLGDLPLYLDPEAIALSFADGRARPAVRKGERDGFGIEVERQVTQGDVLRAGLQLQHALFARHCMTFAHAAVAGGGIQRGTVTAIEGQFGSGGRLYGRGEAGREAGAGEGTASGQGHDGLLRGEGPS